MGLATSRMKTENPFVIAALEAAQQILAPPLSIARGEPLLYQVTVNNEHYEMIVWWTEEDKAFVVDVPELPGCMAHGNTRTEAIANAEDAVALWLKTAKEDGAPIPEPKGRLVVA